MFGGDAFEEPWPTAGRRARMRAALLVAEKMPRGWFASRGQVKWWCTPATGERARLPAGSHGQRSHEGAPPES